MYKNWQAQIQIAIDPDMAVSEGVNAKWQRLVFMLLLALFTVLALRAVGSLLMGALLVIPALTARLLANSPKQMVVWAFVIAQIGVSVGLWSSAGLEYLYRPDHCPDHGNFICGDFYRTKVQEAELR